MTLWQFVATFFYLGKLPVAPGTWGSLGALILWFGWFGFNGGGEIAIVCTIRFIILSYIHSTLPATGVV